MSRLFSLLMLLAVTGAQLAVTPAGAQFGFIFGDPPPRPPQSVPGGRQPSPPPQRQEAPPPGLLPPGPPPSQRGTQPQGNIQSQPLPPPPGGRAAPGFTPDAPAQPAQRQPQRGAPQPPVEAAMPPNDEVLTEPPANKVPNPSSVFAGLDKITGRITSFDVAIGETVQFGALQVTPRACYTRPPTETPHTDAFIEVDEVTLQGEIRRIYTGWMFAASPGLHAVEHPIYDIWLTDCKGGVVAEAQPDPEPTPARATTRQQPSQQRQQQQPSQQRQQPQQPQQPRRLPPLPRDF